MNKIISCFKSCFFVVMVFSFASCGGNSGDVSTSSPTITSFTSDAVTISAGSSVNLTAIFSDGIGSIDNGGGNVTSGIPISVTPTSTTTYTLTITSTAGITVTTTVIVTVIQGTLSLDSLSISGGTLDQVFQSNMQHYTATVGFMTTSVEINATTSAVGAIITVNGVAIDVNNNSQSIVLSEGVNPVISIVVTESDSTIMAYTLTISRQVAAVFAQQAYIKASNTDADDRFGVSVSLYGNTLAVGARFENGIATGVGGNKEDNTAHAAGAVYVFTRSGSVWSQQAYIKASNTGAGDTFGTSVALSEDTLVIGAPLEDSSATGVNGDQTDDSAFDSGAVYVFTRVGTTWLQQAYLKASNTGAIDLFGRSVDLFGDTLVVSAAGEDSTATGVNGNQADNAANFAGAAYVFVRNGTTWMQQAYLKASNTQISDDFGRSIALFENTLAVGAIGESSAATGVNGDQADDSAFGSGAVYVFTRVGTTWSQQAYIKASNTEEGDYFGQCVDLSEDLLAVCAVREDSTATGVDGDQEDNTAPSSGAVYVFVRSGSTWSQQTYLKASNTEIGDNFGISIALSGDVLAVGANTEDSAAMGVDGDQANNSVGGSGAVYVFSRSGSTWSQQAYIKSSNPDLFDFFGHSVSIFNDTLAIGAPDEGSAATNVDGDQIDNSASLAGAVYVFE